MRYPDILSLKSAPSVLSYTKQDVMLYALGVGVGVDSLNEDDLPFVYEQNLRVLPTMCTNLIGKDRALLTEAGVDFRKIVHSEQRLHIHNPLPPEAGIVAEGKIAHVADKGADKGAILSIEHSIRNNATGTLYATMTLSLFCRGVGGFGGPHESAQLPHNIPERAAEHEIILPTAPSQAALFRLVANDANPLHIDPRVAAQVGFERPVLHGLCTYGFACRAVMKAYCENDPARIKSFDVRFAAPFFPGETLATRTWRDGSTVSFECLSVQRGVAVLKNGRCDITA